MTASWSAFQQWLAENLGTTAFKLDALPGDASFRRYFRVHGSSAPLLAVLSPPATENNAEFVRVAQAFTQSGLHVPKVHAADVERGFLLVSDLGDAVFLTTVTADTASLWYTRALQDLAKIQRCNLTLAHFDDHWLATELQHFREWVVEKHLHITISPAVNRLLQQVFNRLIETATAQPQCCIHRDYHSRNLMCLADEKVGILDFQDAMYGPVTYDLISLIRDCYVIWPPAQVTVWAEQFYEDNLRAQIPSREQFMLWMDYMGLQRHLKAGFIFARKFHRDQVSHYLPDLQRAAHYISEISARYAELSEFHHWFTQEIQPRVILECTAAC